jgi:hypothetical protein
MPPTPKHTGRTITCTVVINDEGQQESYQFSEVGCTTVQVETSETGAVNMLKNILNNPSMDWPNLPAKEAGPTTMNVEAPPPNPEPEPVDSPQPEHARAHPHAKRHSR